MVQARSGQRNSPTVDEDEKPPSRYFVDASQADIQHRSLAVMVAARRCFAHQQADEEAPAASSAPQPYIDTIAGHCVETSDYLLPDTPLKEAIFRVILAGGNEPTTAEDIGRILADKWAMSPYPRDLSPEVLQRLLDHSESYLIVKLPEPVVEEEEEEAPEEPVAELEQPEEGEEGAEVEEEQDAAAESSEEPASEEATDESDESTS